MADARARGWGHPDEPGYRERNIVSITAGGVRLNVHRVVARLFKGFVDELVGRGYRLDVVADDWGWVNRDIRGRPGVKSNHAWGLAVDLNSTGNPMTEAHPSHAGTGGHDHRGVHTDMPPWTGDLARRWGLMWGANYSGTRKDAMHFEFLGRPEDAARYPLGGGEPTTFEEDDTMHGNVKPGQDTWQALDGPALNAPGRQAWLRVTARDRHGRAYIGGFPGAPEEEIVISPQGGPPYAVQIPKGANALYVGVPPGQPEVGWAVTSSPR